MKKMNNKGFSLIELIIVIAIMAVLVAVIAPNLTGYIGKSKVNADNSNADTIESAINTCLQDLTSDETIGAYKANPCDYTTVDQIVAGATNKGDTSKTVTGINLPTGTQNKAAVKTAFEDHVYKSLSKYIDTTANRIVPKQDKFVYYIEIKGSYDGGYTCRVECAEKNPFTATPTT